MKDVPIVLLREEFVEGTVLRERNILAVMKDVPTMLLVKEFVSGTVPK